MADLFRHFFWLIFPILGMGMGAFAIWNEFSRQKKALEVLKVYAEKGQEPPESVMQILGRARASVSAQALSRAMRRNSVRPALLDLRQAMPSSHALTVDWPRQVES